VNRGRLALAAAALVGVQVGATIVATRGLVDQLGPATIACVRYAIAVATLLPFLALAAARTPIARADRLPVAMLGIGQFALLIAWLNIGLRTVPAAPAALLFATFPLLTLLAARAFGHERLSTAQLGAVGFTLAGVAVALGGDALRLGRSWTGELAVLASALIGALCSVWYRPYLRRYPALPVSVWAMAAAVVFLAVWAATERAPARLAALDSAGWAALAFIGLSSGGAYFLWLWALRHASASRVTLFLALSPLSAIALGAWWLGEEVPARLWAALALVAAGLVLSARAPATPAG
jgi:drug/metabolite transporter (DMT)-like permease